MSNRNQPNSKIFERIALIAVIVFAGIMAYAIRVSSKTVASVKQDHYSLSQNGTVQMPSEDKAGS